MKFNIFETVKYFYSGVKCSYITKLEKSKKLSKKSWKKAIYLYICSWKKAN